MTASVAHRSPIRPIILGMISIMSLAFVSACNLSKMLTTSTQNPTLSPTLGTQDLTTQTTDAKPAALQQQSNSFTPQPTSQAPTPASDRIILSLAQAGREHLYVYHPMLQPLVQLTTGDCDDRDPAVSPDGKKIAFTSNRNGSWDLYVLDLTNQQVTQLTDTPDFDGSPSWSPDGQWIAYETYDGSFFDIIVMPANDTSIPSIQLTEDSGNNFAPAWSPAGREVAFVTDREGSDQIWIADLDKVDERYKKITGSVDASYTSPAWSPNGAMLAWTKTIESVSTVETSEEVDGVRVTRSLGQGSEPVWSPDGSALLVQIGQPNATYLAGYTAADFLLLFPAHLLPSSIHGADWRPVDIAALDQNIASAQDSGTDAGLLWDPVITGPVGMNNRKSLVQIPGVSAAYPYLQDGIDESFNALRAAAGRELGWDFLSRLDDAVLPISAPPQPGLSENWLYTGRAINVDSTPLDAGWISVTREDFEGRVYWRVWVRCLNQDGSCGEPQHLPSWNFSARYDGDDQAYEDGGRIGEIPSGYWVNLTDLALTYGWERSASLTNWRAYFQATLFNQFVLRQGISWGDAMLELYPAEVLQGADGSIPLPIKQ